MKNLIFIGLGIGIVAWVAWSAGPNRPAGSSRLYDEILANLYGDLVPTVQPAALAAQLRAHPDSVLLLDTRTPEEYEVSHLEGAKLVDYNSYKNQGLEDIPRTRSVVVYCSVGARSQNVGEYLRALGFNKVSNLYGGLFEWVNEGYAMCNSTGPTRQVHPYNTLWGLLLREGEKVNQAPVHK